MAGVVGQEGVDTDGMLSGQVTVDDPVGQRNQRAIGALGAFDAWLFADARTPLVRAGRGIAGLAGGLAFPAHRVDVRSSAEEATKKGDLLGGREL